MQKQPRKIIVIGTTGAGKSTLAARIAAQLGYPHVDLDDLYWLPGWQMRPKEEFRSLAVTAAATDTFAISGNYFSTVAADIWPRSDTLVWIDYSFWRILAQLLKRSWRRSRDGNLICNGNRESWWKLFSTDSIILWFFKSFRKNRRRYADVFAHAGLYPNLNYIRLTSPAQTDQWLQSFKGLS